LADEVVWYVRPLAAPCVLRHCTVCARTRAYAPSQTFRVNAQQRRLDVWLLYRCVACDDTWKRSVLRRVSRDALAPELLERFLRNDPATAWQAACVPAPGLQLVPAPAVRVERPPLDGQPVLLRLTVAWPCGVRLDRLLAAELACSREALLRGVHAGEIEIERGGRRALAHPPRDGTRIVLSRGAHAGSG
jgi:hypothetical protein